MFFRKKKALIDCDPRELDLEMLSFLQSSVMAKLLLVNRELIRRWEGLGRVVVEMDYKDKDENLRTFFPAVDRCERMNAVLEVALAEKLPQLVEKKGATNSAAPSPTRTKTQLIRQAVPG